MSKRCVLSQLHVTVFLNVTGLENDLHFCCHFNQAISNKFHLYYNSVAVIQLNRVVYVALFQLSKNNEKHFVRLWH